MRHEPLLPRIIPDDPTIRRVEIESPPTQAVLKYILGFGHNMRGNTVEEVAKRICADFERSSEAVKATGIEVGR